MKQSLLCTLTLAAVIGSAPLYASKFLPVDVPVRIQGSDRVVVATVAATAAKFETNESGDQVIVTHVQLQVEEALKGAAARTLQLQLEGGTVGDVTLEVSSLPALHVGDRAVFFLERAKGKSAGQEYRPHLKGQGIVPLQADNTIKNSSLTLDDIRRMAAAAAR
jgi:hypothetical protein